MSRRRYKDRRPSAWRLGALMAVFVSTVVWGLVVRYAGPIGVLVCLVAAAILIGGLIDASR